jgi:hypothetical protein
MNTWSNTEQAGLTPTSRRRLEEAIEVAARLAGTDAIGAIHLATAERPTYDELRLFQQIAACCGLTLTLTADSIILRPKPVDPLTAEHAPALGLAALLPHLGHAAGSAWRRVHDGAATTPSTLGLRAGMRRLHDHAAGWNAGFQGLSEGTR